MNGYFYIRTTSTAIQELYAIYIDKEEASEDDEWNIGNNWKLVSVFENTTPSLILKLYYKLSN